MAERRMFAKTIIDSDAFLDMPLTTQSLYFHLSMRADDDGFINNPKKIQKMIGASDDDLKLLIAKSFLIPFESGIVVIKHWKIHNYIQSDRYKATVYTEEKERLKIKENKAYSLGETPMYTECIQDVSKTDTQVRLGKDRLVKGRLGEDRIDHTEDAKASKHAYGEYNHVKLTDSELEKLKQALGDDMTESCITYLDEYIEMKGYKAKSHYLCIKKWVVDAVKEKDRKRTKTDEEKTKEYLERWANA
jgi:hypothetical protein